LSVVFLLYTGKLVFITHITKCVNTQHRSWPTKTRKNDKLQN